MTVKTLLDRASSEAIRFPKSALVPHTDVARAIEGLAALTLFTFESAAAAEAAFVPTPVLMFRTAGFATAGDGGGTLYERALSGDLQTADGAWWRITTDVYDVRMFGVKVDGVTDNSAAMVTALAAAAGAELRIPAGTLVTGRVTLPSDIIITGAGKELTTIKLKASANDYTIYGSGIENLLMRHLTVDGNFANNPTGDSGVYTLNGVNLDFEFVRVQNCGGAGFFPAAGSFNPSSTSKIRYIGCEAYNNGGDVASAARTGFAANADEVTFYGCRSWENGGGGFKTNGRMIRHYGSYSHDNEGNGFSNDFDTAGQGDVLHYGSIAEDNSENSYYFSQTTRNAELHGCVGRRADGSGIFLLNDAARIRVFGGDFRNNGQDAGKTYRNGMTIRNTGTAPSDILISGAALCDDQGSPTQQYGVWCEGDAGAASSATVVRIVGGTDLSGNAVAPYYMNSTMTTAVVDPTTRGLTGQAHNIAASTVTGTLSATDHHVTTIKGHELSRRGGVRLTALFNITGSAGSKTIRIVVGTTNLTVVASNITGTVLIEAEWFATASNTLRGWLRRKASGIDDYRIDDITVDHTADWVIKSDTTLADAADSVALRLWRIERLNPLF